MEKVRIDQWLWSVRIFKSRSQANNACKTNRIKMNDKALKPSYPVSIGNIIQVRKNGFDLIFRIEDVIKKRVSATLAVPCYTSLTTDEELNKYKKWYIGKARSEIREKGTGRPTKRERRDIQEFKEDFWDDIDQ